MDNENVSAFLSWYKATYSISIEGGEYFPPQNMDDFLDFLEALKNDFQIKE
jgi:hypothetical protein